MRIFPKPTQSGIENIELFKTLQIICKILPKQVIVKTQNFFYLIHTGENLSRREYRKGE